MESAILRVPLYQQQLWCATGRAQVRVRWKDRLDIGIFPNWRGPPLIVTGDRAATNERLSYRRELNGGDNWLEKGKNSSVRGKTPRTEREETGYHPHFPEKKKLKFFFFGIEGLISTKYCLFPRSKTRALRRKEDLVLDLTSEKKRD